MRRPPRRNVTKFRLLSSPIVFGRKMTVRKSIALLGGLESRLGSVTEQTGSTGPFDKVTC